MKIVHKVLVKNNLNALVCVRVYGIDVNIQTHDIYRAYHIIASVNAGSGKCTFAFRARMFHSQVRQWNATQRFKCAEEP